ncbi:hypothetical protein EDF56_107150 [Novosphingobium sp. PhB165]|uniref:CehA/McbA family metallohydrolase n=1 Tax=Novosphingobium sp. PhB165 TaxID=2485105 RepID=UPI0010506870|nr:CehA/McbA family metallohydrolase [Novosphingobium sp. PhB165]TCM16571.1 hypothetical protein EDF56_107150 [Novosphingobium sp. PhB165]
MKHAAWPSIALATFAFAAPAHAATDLPDTVLSGVLERGDLGSYRELPFDVPEGTSKITVDIAWEGRENGTILVTGLYDPERLRGWGGGIKPHIVVANTFASSSYLPGPIRAGRWRLSLSVASIRPGQTSHYKMTVHYDRGPAAQVISPVPVNAAPGWYRGDLHVHTGQSDAACRSQSGRAIPCPVYFSLRQASDRALDFVVVTDHNVNSQVPFLAELAPYFDRMLVIPGREMTTQYGHYNLLGITDFVDFRLGAPGAADINALFDASAETGALISVNHPEIPTGEDCLGCGWSAPNTDYSRVTSMEVANGGIAADNNGAFDDGKGSGTAYWEDLLSKGFHLTGVGGSDNHDPVDGHRGSSPVGGQSPIGTPTTVVHAQSLSQPDILKGIQSGRVFIDVDGSHRGALLDMSATSGKSEAVMGGTLERRPGGSVDALITVDGMKGNRVDLIVDGRHQTLSGGESLASGQAALQFRLPASARARWFRADIRDQSGKRLLIGNPIYIVAPRP